VANDKTAAASTAASVAVTTSDGGLEAHGGGGGGVIYNRHPEGDGARAGDLRAAQRVPPLLEGALGPAQSGALSHDPD